jgi:hypothetical protein
MKTADLITAQLHRNPHLIETPRDALRVRDEARPSLRRGRRRRRP